MYPTCDFVGFLFGRSQKLKKRNGARSNAQKNSTSTSVPPAPNEFEVSLFGPGIGESAVLHVGDGEWIVVDSCVEASTRKPVALAYLRSLGIDPATAVRLIVATHFHDDHLRGLCDVVEACPGARFICSAALRAEEFWQLLEANRSSDIGASGTAEFDRILQLLSARSELRARIISPEFAFVGTRVYERFGTTVPCKIDALSPSSATLTAAHLRIGALLPNEGSVKAATVDIGANDLSLALWVRVGEACALLGGDLEESGRPNEGWQAVIASPVRPNRRAVVFKVPHHGSPTAHHDSVWDAMLAPRPTAMVTPYARGRRKLPAHSDIARLCTKTPDVYVTSLGLTKAPRVRASVVERIVQGIAQDRRVLGVDMGHVRARVDTSSGSVTTDLKDGAFRACVGYAT